MALKRSNCSVKISLSNFALALSFTALGTFKTALCPDQLGIIQNEN